MSYSLVSAAAACGLNRSTVLRAIKAGKISAQRDAQGAWEIMPAKLHRVFPPLPRPTVAMLQAKTAKLPYYALPSTTCVPKSKISRSIATAGTRHTWRHTGCWRRLCPSLPGTMPDIATPLPEPGAGSDGRRARRLPG
jgi:hypothetical protein